jgi:hypothetical protein
VITLRPKPGTHVPGYELASLGDCFQPSLRDWQIFVLAPGTEVPGYSQSPLRGYVLAADFFFWATVPLRGPLRVRALVWVR